MPPRHTVARSVTLRGVGLHTGVDTTIHIRPGPTGHGIVFRRIDLPGCPAIPATLASVEGIDRRTALSRDGAAVETVEHLLAAAYALAVDDLTIDVDGPEIPAGDGSAHAFYESLLQAGPVRAPGSAPVVRLPAPLEVRCGDAAYVATPSTDLVLDVAIAWDHPLIGRQHGRYAVTAEGFGRDLARARTFGFAAEAGALRARGLARGATVENAVVLTETGLVAGGLRWPDEFVRHKAVDLLGDLALLGDRLTADISAVRPSHAGNRALAVAILNATTRKERVP